MKKILIHSLNTINDIFLIHMNSKMASRMTTLVTHIIVQGNIVTFFLTESFSYLEYIALNDIVHLLGSSVSCFENN